jgi:hypothetical protein
MNPTQRADTDDDRTLSTPMADIVKGMAKAMSQLQVGEKKRYKLMCKLLLLICRSLKQQRKRRNAGSGATTRR